MIERLKGAFHWLLELLFWMIMFVCLVTSVVVFTSNQKNHADVRLFGIIQSGSMEASGYDIGDVVFINKAKQEYQVGDVILFYRAPTEYGKPIKDANVKSVSVWVHQIIDVGVDDLGRTTYLTKGTSNLKDDVYYVPEDFVLGEAVQLPKQVNLVFRFLLSVWGIVLTIVVPSATLFILFTIEFIRIFIEMYKEIGDEEDAKALQMTEQAKWQPYGALPPSTYTPNVVCPSTQPSLVGIGNCRVCKCAQCPQRETCGFCVACRIGSMAMAQAQAQAQTLQQTNVTAKKRR